MPAIVEFPTVVKEALEEFGPAFANEPERKHFAEYLTGMMIANKKDVSAINREFAVTTDQSCLNRWITEAEWDEEAFNNQYEYIELHNISAEPVTLYRYDKGDPWKFTDGIEFTFPADVPVR